MITTTDSHTIIVNVSDGEVTSVSGIPEGTSVIVRDWDRGSTPDENGDLYEDTEV